MQKKIEWKWEQLEEGTWRAKVIGGWLLLHLKTFAIKGKDSHMCQSESMTFIPDRDHEWFIIKPVDETIAIKEKAVVADFVSSK